MIERHAASPSSNGAWKWVLVTLCAAAFVVLCAGFFDIFGLGDRPWFGYWDSVTITTERPFVDQIVQTVPGGAAERSGLRDGDRIDLRDLSFSARVALLFQPMATRPTPLLVRRGSTVFRTRFLASTVYEVEPGLKILSYLPLFAALFLTVGCACIIALRRSQSSEGRLLCVALLSTASLIVNPTNAAVPSGFISSILLIIASVLGSLPALLPVMLSAQFGVRTVWRRLLEVLTFVIAAVFVGGSVACAIGMMTLVLDPGPLVFGTFWRILNGSLYPIASVTVLAAVMTTPRVQRARAAWLLLPIPTAFFVASVTGQLQGIAPTWEAFTALYAAGNAAVLLGALSVTYALLRRRVLDLNFVIARTLVVAGVSAIVVVSFVLLEWLLNTALSNVSHVTGLAANAGLALVLGLSMQFIHKRVDAFVDFAFFHKRHEDEHALLDFSTEAAFITDREALLGQTMGKLQCHTDAHSAAILLNASEGYASVRSFGTDLPLVDENDPAILALKARHKPVDPHHFATALHGDLALPLLARGRLLGVLLLGERASGEAYAPDEFDALVHFAHGIAVALDALSSDTKESIGDLRRSISALQDALTALPGAIARELRTAGFDELSRRRSL